jgi:hypothetical protein
MLNINGTNQYSIIQNWENSVDKLTDERLLKHIPQYKAKEQKM